MAIAYDAFSEGERLTSATTLTVSHTTSGSDRFLIVNVLSQTSGGGDTITGVTYNGTSLTLVGKRAAGSEYIYQFQLANPASGANNVVVTSSVSGFFQCENVSYTGVNQSAPIDVFTSGSDGSGDAQFTLTTTVDACWMNAGARGSTGTPVSGCVARGGAGGIVTYDTNAAISPAGSNTMTVGNGGTTQFIVSAFKPSVSSSIKTVDGLAYASVKTVNGLAVASVKNINGLA